MRGRLGQLPGYGPGIDGSGVGEAVGQQAQTGAGQGGSAQPGQSGQQGQQGQPGLSEPVARPPRSVGFDDGDDLDVPDFLK